MADQLIKYLHTMILVIMQWMLENRPTVYIAEIRFHVWENGFSSPGYRE